MKDIKANIIKKIKAEKQVEVVVNTNYISTGLFGFMVGSIAIYIFFISSSIFFSIKENQMVFKTQNIQNINLVNKNSDITIFAKKTEISYLNRNSDTAISLK